MSVLSVCMSVYHIHAVSWRPEEGLLGLKLQVGCEQPCGCWKLKPGLLEEQSVLFTTEFSL